MENGFFLHSCSNMEQLVSHYCRCRQEQPEQFFSSDIFTAETVIVPSRGIRQWLERTIADQGIFLANVEFCNIFHFTSRLLNSPIFGEKYFPERFSRKVMVWSIDEILADDSDQDFELLHHYICDIDDGESAELRRFSLAEKIAALFDNYLKETPELLAREEFFQTPPDNSFQTADHWQAKLWQKLCLSRNGETLDSPADRLMMLLNSSPNTLAALNLPPITIFGASSLPPAPLALLKKLAQITAVNFFCINPANAAWDEESRRRWENGTLTEEPQKVKEFFDRQLLKQLAWHERFFFRTLTDISPSPLLPAEISFRRSWVIPENEYTLQERLSGMIPAPPPHGVLQAFQHSIFTDGSALDGFAADDTVTVHNCHTPARQVEILHDHLLHLIEKHHYSNSDIIVAAPDITLFAPYVQSVFERQIYDSGKSYSLEYSFCGLGVHRSNPLAGIFLELLNIGKSRYELDFVEKIIATPEVRKRFGLDDEDLQIVHSWCQKAGIFWGANGDRQQYGIPDYENFSWRYGLDRMLLGFALDENDSEKSVWQMVTPCAACDSQENRPRLLALLNIFRDLRRVEELLDFSGPAEEWKSRLQEIIRTFFACDLDRKSFYRGLINAVNALTSQALCAEYTQNIPLTVIRKVLDNLFSVPAEDEEFLGGKITFCNLQDARSIPCKVLCLLGMDEAAFPRKAKCDNFDLIADVLDNNGRSQRFQDRYFFLENLLAVRDHLLIYYRGQDDVGDKQFSPSTIITELCSYIRQLFPNTATEFIGVKHKLLTYSHSYFQSGDADGYSLHDLWSYNGAACRIDEQLNDKVLEKSFGGNDSDDELANRRMSFRKTDIFPVNDDELTIPVTVDLRELEDFFINGGYIFLKNAFAFPKQHKFNRSSDDNKEPIIPNPLVQWQIKDFLSRWLVGNIPESEQQNESVKLYDIPDHQQVLDQCHRHFCSRNMLPPGKYGRQQLESLAYSSWITNTEYRKEWRKICASDTLRQLTLEFNDLIPRLPNEAMLTPMDWHRIEAMPKYSKVILQHSTGKPAESPQIMVTLGSSSNKYQSRFYLRHLFFNAVGEKNYSCLIKDCLNPEQYLRFEGYDDPALPGGQLRKIIAFYLYGKTHPLPIMENCLWQKFEQGFRIRTRNGDFGDFALDYVRLLWGDDNDIKNDTDTASTIASLQMLRKIPQSE